MELDKRTKINMQIKWKNINWKSVKSFMVFKMGLLRKSDFTDYWSTREKV